MRPGLRARTVRTSQSHHTSQVFSECGHSEVLFHLSYMTGTALGATRGVAVDVIAPSSSRKQIDLRVPRIGRFRPGGTDSFPQDFRGLVNELAPFYGPKLLTPSSPFFGGMSGTIKDRDWRPC